MPSKKILTPLLPDNYYHIYNRGNNSARIYFTPENYRYFINKYWTLLGAYVQTYAFCLLGNHFHFLIKVNDSNEEGYHLKVSHQFRRMFQSYALAINKQEGRSGSLFQKHFRRIQVNDMDYLMRLVFYIHFNPQKHQIVQNFRSYPYSSYNSFTTRSFDSMIDCETVYAWFNGHENFINYHDVLHDERRIKKISLEDD